MNLDSLFKIHRHAWQPTKYSGVIPFCWRVASKPFRKRFVMVRLLTSRAGSGPDGRRIEQEAGDQITVRKSEAVRLIKSKQAILIEGATH